MEISTNTKIVIGFVAGVLLGVVTSPILMGKARAADKGGIDEIAPRATKELPWQGPYIGGSVGWATGSLDGGPFDLSMSGGTATGTIGYDRQFGYLVAGVGLEYTKVFGDLNSSLGVSHDISGFVRAGFLLNPSSLVYGHVGYGRIASSDDGVNSLRIGPGIELRLPGTPFTLDTRYTYHVVDQDAFGSADVSAHVIRSGINWRF